MPDWRNPDYLLHGSARQRAAYQALKRLRIFERLPGAVLAGTIPLGIDVPDSDLDILAEAADLPALSRALAAYYGDQDGYHTHYRAADPASAVPPALVVRFNAAGFVFEIFAQDVPVHRQAAYRHMDVEHRLLALGGEPMRRAVRRLKAAGIKTEPAFAQVFGLTGDPYQALLELADLPDSALRQAVRPGSGPPHAP